MKSERAEGARKFLGLLSIKFSGFSSEKRLSLRVSPHSKRNTEKRVHLVQDKGRFAFLAKKGAPKLNFHRERGGAVAPTCPLNPPLHKFDTVLSQTLYQY